LRHANREGQCSRVVLDESDDHVFRFSLVDEWRVASRDAYFHIPARVSWRGGAFRALRPQSIRGCNSSTDRSN
jgi:hypothetical protein